MASGLNCFKPKKQPPARKAPCGRVLYEPPDTEEVGEERVMVASAQFGVREDGEEGFQAEYEKEVVETEQISTSEAVQRSTIVITGVIDPGTGEKLSLKDALNRGIVDQSQGTYTDPGTGKSVPIPSAINAGAIQVEIVKNHGTEERRHDIGLITIRTTRGNRPFHIETVIDAKSEKEFTLEKAIKKGLLDQESGLYKNNYTGEMMSIADAVDSGLVIVSFDDDEEAREETEVVSKTYAIRAVLDPESKERLPFTAAVESGILDPDTGAYNNKATGETLYASDAIQKGLIKATIVNDKQEAKHAKEKHDQIMAKFQAAKGKLVANAAATSYLKETRLRKEQQREAERRRGKRYLYY